MFDVTFKPYIWQASNTSQQLGVIGTLAALVTFFMLVRLLLRRGRGALRRVAPLLGTQQCPALASRERLSLLAAINDLHRTLRL